MNQKSCADNNRSEKQPLSFPIVSRRRLLRSGIASIPVLLTMAARNPAFAVGAASAASACNYDNKGIFNRFINSGYLVNGTLQSDVNGFVLNNGTYIMNNTTITATGTSTITDNGTEYIATFTATVTCILHKNGKWYSTLINTGLNGTTDTLKIVVSVAGTTPPTVNNIFDVTVNTWVNDVNDPEGVRGKLITDTGATLTFDVTPSSGTATSVTITLPASPNQYTPVGNF